MSERIVGLMEGGHVTPYVGRVLPLNQTAEAHRLILEPGSQGKIVIQLDAAQTAEETIVPEQQ